MCEGAYDMPMSPRAGVEKASRKAVLGLDLKH